MSKRWRKVEGRRCSRVCKKAKAQMSKRKAKKEMYMRWKVSMRALRRGSWTMSCFRRASVSLRVRWEWEASLSSKSKYQVMMDQ